MQPLCPECQHPLDWQRESNQAEWYCTCCEQHYHRQALCPECGGQLEVLRACGAVDYFCSHGHGLISRRKAQICYLRIYPDSESP